MTTFNLPELGEGLEEGEIVGWKVKEGDQIEADHTMVEVMTDKATVEVPAPRTGKVVKLHYQVGDTAKVGAPLIDIEVAGAAAQPKEEKKPEEAPQEVEEVQAREATTGGKVSSPRAHASSRVLASPAIRKMARELGLDLSQVQGSGDRGRILRKDLEHPEPSTTKSPGSPLVSIGSKKEERIPFVGVRRKIAQHLSKSMYTAVHFTHHDEADCTELIRLRKVANEHSEKNKLGIRVTYLPFFMKAAIAAMRKYPILNSSLDEEKNEIIIKHYYHFGISVQTEDGLKVAVIRDCDRKNIFEIASELKSVAERAREGKATREDLTGSTITITNVGNIGGLHATPVINFPEAAILGMYQIKKRPVVREEHGEDIIVSRPMMYTNVTCDHRIIDGAVAAEFLRMLCGYLENPATIAFY